MASLNRVILCGNLTRDPETSFTPSGMAITKVGLAVNERVKNQQTGEWSDRANYFDVTAFGRQAEVCRDYLRKGSPMLMEGRLRWESWEDKDGNKRSKVSVVADRVQLIGGRGEGSEGGGGYSSPAPAAAPAAPRAPAAPPPTPTAPPMPEVEDDDDLPF